jgi:hypothetical protein
MVTQTETGTLLVRDIEYNEYPPPQQLIKAMERRWANEIIKNGVIRVRKSEYHRQWENDLLGDPNDGNGLYHLEGHPMQTGTVNDVYAWCLSLPEISDKHLWKIAEHGNYDCTIIVHAMDKLLTRIQSYLQQNNKGFWMHCGCVNYNRGAEVDKATLNSQKFHFNIFQKGTCFQEDKEYRVSIINCTFEKSDKNYLDIVIGNCSDIISMQPLPNKPLKSIVGPWPAPA